MPPARQRFFSIRLANSLCCNSASARGSNATVAALGSVHSCSTRSRSMNVQRRIARERKPTVPRVPTLPTRRFVSAPRPRWRYFDRSVPESAHLCSQNLGKDPHPVFVLFKSNLPLEGSPVDNVLLDVRWRIARERVPCGYP